MKNNFTNAFLFCKYIAKFLGDLYVTRQEMLLDDKKITVRLFVVGGLSLFG